MGRSDIPPGEPIENMDDASARTVTGDGGVRIGTTRVIPPDEAGIGRDALVLATTESSYVQHPAAELLDGMHMTPDKVERLPRACRMIRIKATIPLKELIVDMAMYGGILALVPFQVIGEAQAVFVFKNDESARSVLARLRIKYPDMDFSVGLSMGEDISTVAAHGVIGFIGPGAERVGDLLLQTGAPDADSTGGAKNLFFLDDGHPTPNKSHILPSLEPIPAALKSSGAAVKIILPEQCVGDDGRLIPVVQKLLNLVDHRRSTFQLLGRELVIASTADEPLASLLIDIKAIIDRERKKSGTAIAAYGTHADFYLEEPSRSNLSQQLLTSEAFGRLASMPIFKDDSGGLEHGVWVTPFDVAELEKPRGGAVIPSRTAFHRGGAQLVRLDEIEARTTTLVVRVAREVLGRDQELERAQALVEHVVRLMGIAVWYVEGEAGIGKSTLVDEIIRRAKREHSELEVLTAKAQSRERMKDFSLVRLFASEMMKKAEAKDLTQDDSYRALYLFRQGQDEEPIDAEFANFTTFQPNPDFLAGHLNDLARSLHCPMIIALDDLQFADPKSVLTISKFIEKLDAESGIMFIPIARSGEQEMPQAIRDALLDFDLRMRAAEHPHKCRIERTHVTPLKFFEVSGDGKNFAPTELLQRFFKSCIAGDHEHEEVRAPILTHLFSSIVGPDGYANPFYATQIMLMLQERDYIGLDSEGKIDFRNDIRQIEPRTLAMDNLLRNRFEHLRTNHPDLLKTLREMLLFKSGIRATVFYTLFPEKKYRVAQLQTMGFIAIYGGKITIVHDLMRNHGEDFFTPDSDAGVAFYNDLDRAMKREQSVRAEIPPELLFELLQPAAGSVEQKRVRGHSFDDLRIRCLGHGMLAARTLNDDMEPSGAAEILEWINAKLLNDITFADVETRMHVDAELMRAYSMNGRYVEVGTYADRTLRWIVQIMEAPGYTRKREFERLALELHRAKCRASFRLQDADAFPSNVSAFGEALSAYPEIEDDDNLVCILEHRLYEAAARYLPAYKKAPLADAMTEFDRAIAGVESTIAEVNASMKKETRSPRVNRELRQLHFEAKRLWATMLQFKEVHRIESLGDADALLAIQKGDLPSGCAESMARSERIIDELIIDFSTSDVPLLSDNDGKQLGSMYYMMARARLMTDQEYKKAMRNLDEAARVSAANPSEHAFFLQKKADFQFMYALRQGGFIDSSQASEITKLYRNAIETLGALGKDSDGFPTDSKYKKTACNFAGFVLHCAELDEKTKIGLVSNELLMEAWQALRGSLKSYTRDFTFRQTFVTIQPDGLVLEMRGDIAAMPDVLQYLLPKIGDFVNHAERMDITLPDLEAVLRACAPYRKQSLQQLTDSLARAGRERAPNAVLATLGFKKRGAQRFVDAAQRVPR